MDIDTTIKGIPVTMVDMERTITEISNIDLEDNVKFRIKKVSEIMDEAEYCDRIMIQDQGKTIVLGTPDEIRKEAGENLTMNEAFVAIVEKNRHRKEM